MPPAHAPSAHVPSLSRSAAHPDASGERDSGVVERLPAWEAHGVPLTSSVLEAMNVFATAGAFATLLVVAAVTLAWRSAVQDAAGWGALSVVVFAAALGLFLHARAKLLATFEAACADEGVPLAEAQRRARTALRHSLPRPRLR